ncbi:hypothetical protein [Pseudoalteromonas sp. B160]|uniref:hypothetical protein n=1 Tax=Pseudoalteromonas sp. B160 TaxID=630414 RepID=UPI00301BC623
MVTFCSHAYATNIFQLNSQSKNVDLTSIQPNHPQWNASSIYVAGDVVTHNNSLFIAAFWVKGIEPIENQPHWDGWIWLQNTVIEKWQANKVYQAGNLVKHGADYYLARYWNENNEPAPAVVGKKLKIYFTKPQIYHLNTLTTIKRWTVLIKMTTVSVMIMSAMCMKSLILHSSSPLV